MHPYCEHCLTHPGDTLNAEYHATQYGFPIADDNLLFERLILEINQAGLSWITILRKAQNFRQAYSGFNIDAVAAYGERDIARLLGDAGIIRNRKKIEAAIFNARVVQGLQTDHGSFAGWIDSHHPTDLAGWAKLFKGTFRFTGPEIINEFLMSSGYLPGAHSEDCPVYAQIAALTPPWMHASSLAPL